MRWFVLGILLTVLGCQAAAPQAIPDLRWPPAPANTRIQLTQILNEPGDLGLRPPWYARLWQWVAGEEADMTLVQPSAVAFRGHLLAISDLKTSSVLLINRETATVKKILSVGGLPLQSPVGLAWDARGLWISDGEAGRVIQINLEGEAITTVTGLERPAGLAVANDGRIAVAQPAAHRVTVIGPGDRRVDIGRSGDAPGEFNFPTQVAFGPDGALYVNDALNFRIQRFAVDLSHAGMFGQRGDAPGWFGRARGIAVDEAGHIYVADALFDVVQVFDPAGRLLLVIGTGGSGPGEFWMPFGLFYHAGRLAVADAENARVQFFQVHAGEGL